MIFLDSSVLVALYCPEPVSQKAEVEVRQRLPASISDLVEVEFASALALKARIGEISAGDASAFNGMLEEHLAGGVFDRLPLEREHFGVARRWIGGMTCPLRSGDALHLALAHDRGLDILTADKRMAAAAHVLGVSCTLVAT